MDINRYRAWTIDFLGWKVKADFGSNWIYDGDKKVMRHAFWAPDKSAKHRQVVEDHVLSLGYDIDWYLNAISCDVTISNTENKWESVAETREASFAIAWEQFYKSLL